MSCQRYKEYCEARRASFCPRLRVNKFRDWLLGEENSDVKLTQLSRLTLKTTQLVLEMLNHLEHETVTHERLRYHLQYHQSSNEAFRTLHKSY
ncbi:hypothetical protein E2C01_003398 [Portunus trituberculatus]|uniref:Uncharacterized protein n=1 Tax=Portunus trituberculatus TaxID=210409 RepID=A0A5B7CMR1_PORTR|nr:hypothetical protein [Portunus trituberculatus]